MAGNTYYTPSGNPITLGDLASAEIRQEFRLIKEALDNLPALGRANAGKQWVMNAAGTAVIASERSGGVLVPAADVGGTANALALAPMPALAALTDGVTLRCVIELANTGAMTAAVSGLAPVPIRRRGNLDIPAGYFQPGDIVTFFCRGGVLWVQDWAAGTAARKDVGTAQGQLAELGAGGKFAAERLPSGSKTQKGILEIATRDELNAAASEALVVNAAGLRAQVGTVATPQELAAGNLNAVRRFTIAGIRSMIGTFAGNFSVHSSVPVQRVAPHGDDRLVVSAENVGGDPNRWLSLTKLKEWLQGVLSLAASRITSGRLAGQRFIAVQDSVPSPVSPTLWLRGDDLRLGTDFEGFVALRNTGDRGIVFIDAAGNEIAFAPYSASQMSSIAAYDASLLIVGAPSSDRAAIGFDYDGAVRWNQSQTALGLGPSFSGTGLAVHNGKLYQSNSGSRGAVSGVRIYTVDPAAGLTFESEIVLSSANSTSTGIAVSPTRIYILLEDRIRVYDHSGARQAAEEPAPDFLENIWGGFYDDDGYVYLLYRSTGAGRSQHTAHERRDGDAGCGLCRPAFRVFPRRRSGFGGKPIRVAHFPDGQSRLMVGLVDTARLRPQPVKHGPVPEMNTEQDLLTRAGDLARVNAQKIGAGNAATRTPVTAPDNRSTGIVNRAMRPAAGNIPNRAQPRSVAGEAGTGRAPVALAAPGAALPESASVESRMTRLLGSDSEYLRGFRTRADQQMQDRGLVLSSLAPNAAERAALEGALPIAQADAQQAGRLLEQQRAADFESRHIGERGAEEMKLVNRRGEIEKEMQTADHAQQSRLQAEQEQIDRRLSVLRGGIESRHIRERGAVESDLVRERGAVESRHIRERGAEEMKLVDRRGEIEKELQKGDFEGRGDLLREQGEIDVELLKLRSRLEKDILNRKAQIDKELQTADFAGRKDLLAQQGELDRQLEEMRERRELEILDRKALIDKELQSADFAGRTKLLAEQAKLDVELANIRGDIDLRVVRERGEIDLAIAERQGEIQLSIEERRNELQLQLATAEGELRKELMEKQNEMELQLQTARDAAAMTRLTAQLDADSLAAEANRLFEATQRGLDREMQRTNAVLNARLEAAFRDGTIEAQVWGDKVAADANARAAFADDPEGLAIALAANNAEMEKHLAERTSIKSVVDDILGLLGLSGAETAGDTADHHPDNPHPRGSMLAWLWQASRPKEENE